MLITLGTQRVECEMKLRKDARTRGKFVLVSASFLWTISLRTTASLTLSCEHELFSLIFLH